ncbi:MAG TPA: DUF2795 domain-containing protein [Candidatus Thermoplasmatota archaeon]|nr:DUF2795 domain-containing protein [Candidatus Thermoplasmatota archaeon]
MTRGVGGESPSNVQKHLEGVSYPATKEDILEAAKRNNAPREIMDFLENMGREEYGGPQDVMKEYGDAH